VFDESFKPKLKYREEDRSSLLLFLSYMQIRCS